MTVRELVALLEEDYRLQGRRSLGNARSQLKHVTRVLGDLPVENLKVALLEEYKAKRQGEGAARATINNELALLRRSFSIAIDREILERCPRIKKFTVENAREGFLTAEEWRRFHAALEVLDPDVADLATFLYFLGWRKREAQELTWAEVEVNGVVRLPGRRAKTREGRRVALSGALLRTLRRRQDARCGPLVFHRGGKPIRDFRSIWRRAAASVGKPGLLVHDLRRSFARNALLAGVPREVIMAIAGWRTASIFRRYAIIDERAVAEAVSQISASVEFPEPSEELP